MFGEKLMEQQLFWQEGLWPQMRKRTYRIVIILIFFEALRIKIWRFTRRADQAIICRRGYLKKWRVLFIMFLFGI